MRSDPSVYPGGIGGGSGMTRDVTLRSGIERHAPNPVGKPHRDREKNNGPTGGEKPQVLLRIFRLCLSHRRISPGHGGRSDALPRACGYRFRPLGVRRPQLLGLGADRPRGVGRCGREPEIRAVFHRLVARLHRVHADPCDGGCTGRIHTGSKRRKIIGHQHHVCISGRRSTAIKRMRCRKVHACRQRARFHHRNCKKFGQAEELRNGREGSVQSSP